MKKMKLRSSRAVEKETAPEPPIEDLPPRKKPKAEATNQVPVGNVRQYPHDFIKFSFDTKNAVWYNPQTVWRQHVMKSRTVRSGYEMYQDEGIGRPLLSLKIKGVIRGMLYSKSGSTLHLLNMQPISGRFETIVLRRAPLAECWTYPGVEFKFINERDKIASEHRLVVAYVEVEELFGKIVVNEAPNVPLVDDNFHMKNSDVGGTSNANDRDVHSHGNENPANIEGNPRNPPGTGTGKTKRQKRKAKKLKAKMLAALELAKATSSLPAASVSLPNVTSAIQDQGDRRMYLYIISSVEANPKTRKRNKRKSIRRRQRAIANKKSSEAVPS